MRAVFIGLHILLLGAMFHSSVWAVTLRYALVVGNNDGLDEDGTRPFPPLTHAEREARLLTQRLITFSNFDSSASRTIVLTGATRVQVLEAVEVLAAQKMKDVAALGQIDTLFAFFFTGHGMNGRLLLNDGPLTGKELGRVFSAIGADFTVGVFDACYSGSLDPKALVQKGIQVSPGNIFRELPEEVLTAEGSIWFASSGPNQVSYEDQQLGGVFTHFFIEALAHAQIDGPGITLEQIWHYARNKTVAHTGRQGRRQIPQQQVNLKSTGPLYFSFPVSRSATLVLRESVQGEFILSYADGQLIERFDKQPGRYKQLAVYPGVARMLVFKEGQVYIQETISFEKNQKVVLRSNRDVPAANRVGEASRTLWVKGLGEHRLTAEKSISDSTWLLGGDYSLGLVPHGLLAPRHSVSVRLRLDRAALSAAAWLGYAHASEDLGDWSYEMDAVIGGLQVGLGWNLRKVRLNASAVFAMGAVFQQFQDSGQRIRWFYEPGLGFGILVPIFGHLDLEAKLQGCLARLPGAGRSAGYHWRLRGNLGVGLLARF